MSEPRRLTIRFTCNQCGLIDGICTVRPRTSPDHPPIVEWVQSIVGYSVQRAHLAHSPKCLAKTVDLKLPMPVEGDLSGPDAWIGMPPITDDPMKPYGEKPK